MELIKKRPKVFYGWYIVASSMLVMVITGGFTHLGFTAVFEPIADELGWSYAQISLAASLRGFESGLLAPLMGFLVDRWGPRRLVFSGSILLCLGFLMLSQVTSLVTFYMAFILIAIGMSACTSTVMMAAVANWFRRRHGLASGITACGFGLGGIMIPIITRLVDVLQWRMALVIVGLSTLASVLPLSLVMRTRPEQYGYQPDGEPANPVASGNTRSSTANPEVSLTTKKALANRAFWHISIAGMCQASVAGAIIIHIMPYLSSVGIERSVSSLIALVIPLVSIGGRLSSGWLCDRVGKKQVFTAGFALMAAGMLIFAYVTSSNTVLLIPFIIVFSLGWGFGVTTRIALIREYHGISSFGKIFGFMMGIVMLGSIFGAPLAGWIYDIWGAYRVAWLGLSVVTIAAMILAITLPPKLEDGG